NHDGGIARDMTAEVTNDHAQVELEGRARRVADHRLDGAATIERRDVVRLRGSIAGENERARHESADGDATDGLANCGRHRGLRISHARRCVIVSAHTSRADAFWRLSAATLPVAP